MALWLREGRRVRRRKWGLWLLAVLVLALVLALVLGALGERQVNLQPAVQAAAALQPPAAPVSEVAPPMPQPASMPAVQPKPPDRPVPERGEGMASPLMERMRADWCGFGAREAERQRQARRASRATASSATSATPPSSEGAQLLEQARRAAARGWVEALRRRGDPRSLAVAESLGGDDSTSTPPASSSRACLQAMAQHSTDPFITALALARPCPAGACRNVDPAQWSRLEPDNLRAWLPLLHDDNLRDGQGSYALERMSQQARYSRSYSEEAAQLLVGALQAHQPGLAYQAETEALFGLFAARATPAYRNLTANCRDASAQCLALAELLWTSEDLIERRVAFSVVRSSLPRTGSLWERWEGRAREAEAVATHATLHLRGLLEGWDQASKADPCGPLASMREAMAAQLTQGEWSHYRGALQADEGDVNALSEQWRREHGRSLLEAPKPAQPAASAAR